MDPKFLMLEEQRLPCTSAQKINPTEVSLSVTPLINLPTNVILHVFAHIRHKDWIRMSQVSTLLHKLVFDANNGLWSYLFIKDTNSFKFLNLLKSGHLLLGHINELTLDQGTCKTFKDHITFSVVMGLICKHCVNLRKLTLAWCGALMNSALVNLGKECSHLQSLSIAFNSILTSDVGIVSLSRLPLLLHLEITAFNNITVRSLRELIQGSKSIRQITIKGCGNIESQALAHLRKLFGHVTINHSFYPVSLPSTTSLLDDDTDDEVELSPMTNLLPLSSALQFSRTVLAANQNPELALHGNQNGNGTGNVAGKRKDINERDSDSHSQLQSQKSQTQIDIERLGEREGPKRLRTRLGPSPVMDNSSDDEDDEDYDEDFEVNSGDEDEDEDDDDDEEKEEEEPNDEDEGDKDENEEDGEGNVVDEEEEGSRDGVEEDEKEKGERAEDAEEGDEKKEKEEIGSDDDSSEEEPDEELINQLIKKAAKVRKKE